MLSDGLDPLDYLDSLCTPLDRARACLLDDPGLTNREVSLMARVTQDQVEGVRAGLVACGVIAPSRATPARHEPRYSERPAPPAILRRGACVNVIPSPWVSDDPGEREHAKTICASCIARVECLEYSLTLGTRDNSIWAGLTGGERNRLRIERAGRPLPHSATTAGKNAARARRRAAAREAAEAAQQPGQAAGGAA